MIWHLIPKQTQSGAKGNKSDARQAKIVATKIGWQMRLNPAVTLTVQIGAALIKPNRQAVCSVTLQRHHIAGFFDIDPTLAVLVFKANIAGFKKMNGQYLHVVLAT